MKSHWTSTKEPRSSQSQLISSYGRDQPEEHAILRRPNDPEPTACAVIHKKQKKCLMVREQGTLLHVINLATVVVPPKLGTGSPHEQDHIGRLPINF